MTSSNFVVVNRIFSSNRLLIATGSVGFVETLLGIIIAFGDCEVITMKALVACDSVKRSVTVDSIEKNLVVRWSCKQK